MDQSARKDFLNKLIGQGVLMGVEPFGPPAKVGVTPLFQGLNPDLQLQFLAVVYAYVHAGLPSPDPLQVIDSTTQSLTVPAATGVLANDTDPEGASLTAALVQGPAHGTLNLSPNGSFTYTPTATFAGTDSFTYQASDGEKASNPVTVTLGVGLANFILLPVAGAISDKIGRTPLLVGATLAALATAYPAMRWLVGDPSFGHLMMVELWLAVIFASYNGAMVVFLTEVMPERVRTSGFSLAYSLATAFFGGFTPAIATWLIHETGDKAMPGAWLSVAAALGLIAALALRGRAVSVARPHAA